MSLQFTQYSDKSYVVRGDMLNDNKQRKELTKNLNGNCIWNTRLKDGAGLLVPINDNNTSYLEKMKSETKDKLQEDNHKQEHDDKYDSDSEHPKAKEKEEHEDDFPPRKIFQSPPKLNDRFRQSPLRSPPKDNDYPDSPTSPLSPPPLDRLKMLSRGFKRDSETPDRKRKEDSKKRKDTPDRKRKDTPDRKRKDTEDSNKRKDTKKRYSSYTDSDSDSYNRKHKKRYTDDTSSDSDRYTRKDKKGKDTRKHYSSYSSSSYSRTSDSDSDRQRRRVSSSSEEDSSEDERILQTLRRKGTTKPGTKVISNEINSDEEDIITLARRIRFQEKRIKQLESEIERLKH